MKRLYCSLLTLVLILAISSSNVLAYGNTLDLMIGSTGVNEKSTFNKNELDKEKKLAIAEDKKIEEYLKKENTNIKMLYNPGYFRYVIDVTNFMQETSYWCGPASVKQALSFHKTKSGSGSVLPSQSTIASKAGTSTEGSTTLGLKNAINNYTGTFSFSSYIAADITDSINPADTLENRIKYDLMNQIKAPVCKVRTDYLSMYGGKQLTHYVTVSGWMTETETNTKSVRYVDPNFNSSYYGTFWENYGSINSISFLGAVYSGDLQSANYAMIY